MNMSLQQCWCPGLVSACRCAPEEAPGQIKLNDLEGRVQRIERESASGVDMAQKLDARIAEIRALRRAGSRSRRTPRKR